MDLLSLAKNVADRVEAQAMEAKVPVAVCVIDTRGSVVLTHCMPGAPLLAIELSERKAYTSALARVRTDDLSLPMRPGQHMASMGRYCAIGGGAPLTTGGEVVGGIGVSGGTTEQDIAIIEAALK